MAHGRPPRRRSGRPHPQGREGRERAARGVRPGQVLHAAVHGAPRLRRRPPRHRRGRLGRDPRADHRRLSPRRAEEPGETRRVGPAMAVERVEVRRRTPFAHGYERIDGVLRFAVRPETPVNAVIVDLGNAPRDADGCVRFEADFCMLEPARPASRLLVVVVNRGRYSLVPFSIPSRPPALTVTDEIDPGDGFLLERGWRIVFCGWQWDVARRPGLLGLSAPEADVEPGTALVRLQPPTARTEQLSSPSPLDPGRDPLLVAH